MFSKHHAFELENKVEHDIFSRSLFWQFIRTISAEMAGAKHRKGPPWRFNSTLKAILWCVQRSVCHSQSANGTEVHTMLYKFIFLGEILPRVTTLVALARPPMRNSSCRFVAALCSCQFTTSYLRSRSFSAGKCISLL